MRNGQARAIEQYLAKPDIHELWETSYHISETEKFFDEAFDYIGGVLSAQKNDTVLDAGCGTCAHSIRLANRGFRVQAVDFSEAALKLAEGKVKDKGLESKIQIQREDVCALSFGDNSFTSILCWGVLMHVPDLERAISELSRVLKPGGTLVVGENNMYSLQAVMRRCLKGVFSRGRGGKVCFVRRASGAEYWWAINDRDVLMTRHVSVRWLINRFESQGLAVKERVAAQFTDAYVKASSRVLKKLIHGFNSFWFRYVRIPHLAFGNIVVVRKEK